MRSIRDWMAERGMLGEDFDKRSMMRHLGSSTVDVDLNLRRELKPKVMRIMDMDEYKSMPKDELLDRLKVVVSNIVSEMGGRKFTSRRLAGNLSDDENEVDKTKFSRMMGSESLEVDIRLKRELRPKLERVMDMEEYKSIPKGELVDKLIVVMSQLVGEMSGSRMSLGTLSNRMVPSEDDPVARESAALPSFLRWIENSEEGEGTSEPQHKEGEENMDLKGVVEKRMMQLAMEIESDGKGSRQEVLAAMKAVVDSAGKESEQQDDPNAPQDPGAQQGMNPGDQPPPPQAMQQPQVQG
jgi:ribosomal protein S13